MFSKALTHRSYSFTTKAITFQKHIVSLWFYSKLYALAAWCLQDLMRDSQTSHIFAITYAKQPLHHETAIWMHGGSLFFMPGCSSLCFAKPAFSEIVYTSNEHAWFFLASILYSNKLLPIPILDTVCFTRKTLKRWLVRWKYRLTLNLSWFIIAFIINYESKVNFFR